jgi:integrase
LRHLADHLWHAHPHRRAQVLGHASPAMTMKVYAHALPSGQEQALLACDHLPAASSGR